MVRKGAPARVRQRALESRRLYGGFCLRGAARKGCVGGIRAADKHQAVIGGPITGTLLVALRSGSRPPMAACRAGAATMSNWPSSPEELTARQCELAALNPPRWSPTAGAV